MAKLSNKQLKKLYDYGGTLSPKDWADMIDSVVPDGDVSGIVMTTYSELMTLRNTSNLTPNQWYQFEYNPYLPTIESTPRNTANTYVRIKAISNNKFDINAKYYGVKEINDGFEKNYVNIPVSWLDCKYDPDYKFDYNLVYNNGIVNIIKVSIFDEELYDIYKDYLSRIKWDNHDYKDYIGCYCSIIIRASDGYDYVSISFYTINDTNIEEICFNNDTDDTPDTNVYRNVYLTPDEQTGFVYDIALSGGGFLSYDMTSINDTTINCSSRIFCDFKKGQYFKSTTIYPITVINSTVDMELNHYRILYSEGVDGDISEWIEDTDYKLFAHIENCNIRIYDYQVSVYDIYSFKYRPISIRNIPGLIILNSDMEAYMSTITIYNNIYTEQSTEIVEASYHHQFDYSEYTDLKGNYISND